MYEHYLAAVRNGVTDVEVNIDEEEFWNTSDDPADGELSFNETAVTVTVTFAVMTDAEAWITIDGDGFVHPAFGGTGTSQQELDEYAEQAVEIWRGITGNEGTTCRYKIPENDRHDRDQDDLEHVIDA